MDLSSSWAGWDILAVPTLHVLQPLQVLQTQLQRQSFQSHPAVAPGDTDLVTSAPRHPFRACTQHGWQFFIVQVFAVWVIPFPPDSPKMTAINPSFPHVPRELHYPNPPQLPTSSISPATFIFHSAPPLPLPANINPAQGSSSICAGTATTSKSR